MPSSCLEMGKVKPLEVNYERQKFIIPRRRGYKGRTILEAKRPLLSLDVEFYLAFHAEGKNHYN